MKKKVQQNFFSCATFVATLFTTAPVLAGSVETYELSATRILRHLNLSATDILAIEPFALDHLKLTRNFDVGVFGMETELKPGAFGVSLTGSAAPIDSALMVTPGTKDAVVTVYSCSGGHCAGLTPSASEKSRLTVAVGKSTISLDVAGTICKVGLGRCIVMVPSWAIAKMLASKDHNLRGLPQYGAMIQTPEHLLLVDATDNSGGHAWMSWLTPDGGVVSSLGKLVQSTMTADGALVNRYERGGLILNFAEDTAILADAAGNLFRLRKGLGSGILDDFALLYEGTAVGSKPGRFLAIGPNFVVTQRGAVAFTYSNVMNDTKKSADGGDPSFKILGTLASTADSGTWEQANWLVGESPVDPQIALLKFVRTSLVVSTLDQNKGFTESVSTTVEAINDPRITLLLMGSELFGRNEKAWLSLTPTPEGTTINALIFRKSARDYAIPSAGQVLEARIADGATQFEGGTCDYAATLLIHQAPNRDAANAKDSCTVQIWYGVANAAGTTGLAGLVKERIFLKLFHRDTGG